MEDLMKRTSLILAFALLAALLCAAPVVTNVNASQRTDGSQIVDVYYNLSNSAGGAMTVWLVGSNDNGYTWGIPCNTVSGAVGQNVYAGNNKHITWNAAVDFPNTSCANFKFKVIAFDGSIPPIPEEFVYVNGGTFSMGNTLGGGNSNELPVHEVTLSSYMIGITEVTEEMWVETMGGTTGAPTNPKVSVSWYSILKYCNLRSMAEGLVPVYTINNSTDPATWGSVPTSNNATWNAAICNWSANGYRLPTEAEWEYAARGGAVTPDYIYSGSDDINLVAWYSGNSGGYVHPVGQKQPNGLGIFDMSGNTWEWCWDWYASAYASEGQFNPTGPLTGSSRLLRGGVWYLGASGCRVSYRYNFNPYYSNYYGGFRLCRAMN